MLFVILAILGGEMRHAAAVGEHRCPIMERNEFRPQGVCRGQRCSLELRVTLSAGRLDRGDHRGFEAELAEPPFSRLVVGRLETDPEAARIAAPRRKLLAISRLDGRGRLIRSEVEVYDCGHVAPRELWSRYIGCDYIALDENDFLETCDRLAFEHALDVVDREIGVVQASDDAVGLNFDLV